MKDGFDPEVDMKNLIVTMIKRNRKLIESSEKKQESQKLQPIVETENKDRFPTAEERCLAIMKQLKKLNKLKLNLLITLILIKDLASKLEETDVNSLKQCLGLIKKPEQLNEQPQLSDLEKLQLEFY